MWASSHDFFATPQTAGVSPKQESGATLSAKKWLRPPPVQTQDEAERMFSRNCTYHLTCTWIVLLLTTALATQHILFIVPSVLILVGMCFYKSL